MDTKWKKSKAILGFTSFALGVSLLLASLLPIAGNLVSESGRDRLENSLKRDFQETSIFRDYLSNVMNSFIAMGVGGPINGSYYGSYGYDYGVVVSGESEVMMEAAIAQAVSEDGELWYVDDPYFNYQPSEADRERWKKEAEIWSKQFQDDKNILYYITVNSRLVYTNMEQPKDAVPVFPAQGYSFRLSFDGRKCEATRDEEKLDLYGNGYYAEDGKHWSLPGYSNFQAGDEAKTVRVSLAVADAPALYVKASFANGWNQRQSNNRYYWHYQGWQENRQKLVVNAAILLGIGLVFAAVWFWLRREKPLADQAIAGVTRHIWFEIKVALLLCAVILLFLPLTEDMRYLFSEITYAISIEDVGYYQTPWFLGQYLYEIACRPGVALIAFWMCWLFINDLRYGDKPWRHGICGMLRAKSLKLPMQKRISRQCGWMGIALLLVGAEQIFFLILATVQGSLPRWSIWNLFLLPLLTSVVIYLVVTRRFLTLAKDLGLLSSQITAVHNGDLSVSILPADSDLGSASQAVADIQQGMAKAVAEQTRSERMKVELVTNVSHDIKTPLTSIISYAELLKQEELPPPSGEYVDILCQKAERLRAMVLDVFEISKASSGNLPVKLETLDLAKLLRQTIADMAQAIEAAPVTLREALPEEPVTIIADGDRLYRVFQNLLQNALQYALEGSRVYLTVAVRDGAAEVSIKNTSKTELPDGVDFTARFVRGDESRTDGGSGLGLAIAASFARACGGELRVEPVADLFVVTVSFPLSDTVPEESLD